MFKKMIQLFRGKPKTFNVKKQMLVLTHSDGSIKEYKIPNCWEDVTVNQVIEIQKMGDDMAPIDLFCIMTGVSREDAYKIDLDIIVSVGYSFAFMHDAEALAKSFKEVPEDYAKKKIGKMMFGVVYECQMIMEREMSEPWEQLEARKKVTERILGFEVGQMPYSEWNKTFDFFWEASLDSMENLRALTRQKKTQFQNRRGMVSISRGLLAFITLFITWLIMTYCAGMTYIVCRLIEYLCCF